MRLGRKHAGMRQGEGACMRATVRGCMQAWGTECVRIGQGGSACRHGAGRGKGMQTWGREGMHAGMGQGEGTACRHGAGRGKGMQAWGREGDACRHGTGRGEGMQ
eukprot:215657-Chlamydomonas_euryale.AAC.1